MAFANLHMLARGGLLDDVSTKKNYDLGFRVTDTSGNVYEYVKIPTSNAVTVGQAMLLLSTGAVPITTTLAADGAKVGVAINAVTSDSSNVQYTFVLVATGAGQVTSVLTANSTAAAQLLNTTGTAGSLDDATGGVMVTGISLEEATAGDETLNETAHVSFPVVGATGTVT